MQLEKILKISLEMVAFAKKDRWDEVQSREVQRQEMLSEFFSDFIPEEVGAEQEGYLQQILALNKELLNMAEEVRQDFISVVADAVLKTKAVQKYEKHRNI